MPLAAKPCPRGKSPCPAEKCRPSGLARGCSTLDLPHLRGAGCGPSFNLGVEFAPKLLQKLLQKLLGEWNDLEDSENCRSAGGHGNQHVRLRSAQIDRIETIGPARSAILASSRGRRPDNGFQTLDRRQTALKGVKRIITMTGPGIGRPDTAPSVCLIVFLGSCAQAWMRESMRPQACKANTCSLRRSGNLFAGKVRGQNNLLRFVNRGRNNSEIFPEYAAEVRRTRKAP